MADKNAYKYGFIMSYPKGKEKITGYIYEPWHWRFVGLDLAKIFYNLNLTYNELDLNLQNKPYPKEKLNNSLEISAGTILSVFINQNGQETILLEKNKNLKLPIGNNLTKLIFDLLDLNNIEENALNTYKEIEAKKINYLTANDINKLLKYIFENKKDLLKNINKNNEEEIYDLKVLSSIFDKTFLLKENLVIITESPTNGYIITSILDSENAYEDIQRTIKYIKESFDW